MYFEVSKIEDVQNFYLDSRMFAGDKRYGILVVELPEEIKP